MSSVSGGAMDGGVNVEIKYLSVLRDRTGKRCDRVTFAQGSTVRDVAEWLREHYGLSLPDPTIMATINGRGWEQLPRGTSTELAEGDVICLFAPLSGG